MDASSTSNANEMTPEIESILNALTDLGCEMLGGQDGVNFDRIDQLVQSLSSNGWERSREDREPLSVILKNRMKEKCREPAMHRGAAMDGIVAKIQKACDVPSRYKSSSPAMQDDPDRHSSSPRTTLNS